MNNREQRYRYRNYIDVTHLLPKRVHVYKIRFKASTKHFTNIFQYVIKIINTSISNKERKILF